MAVSFYTVSPELFPIEVDRKKSPAYCKSEHLYPIDEARRSDDALASRAGCR
jgi:hypothetical protein